MAKRFDNAGFKATASHLTEAILITDAQGRITWANRAFKTLCGYHLKEIIGQKPGDFLQGPGTDPKTIAAMHHAVEERQYFHTEILNYHKKGRAYWAAISITPFYGQDGELEGHIGLAHDITEQRIEIALMERDIVTMYTALISESYDTEEIPEDDPFLSHMRFSAWSLTSEQKNSEPHRRNR